jgi:hypothetical protein
VQMVGDGSIQMQVVAGKNSSAVVGLVASRPEKWTPIVVGMSVEGDFVVTGRYSSPLQGLQKALYSDRRPLAVYHHSVRRPYWTAFARAAVAGWIGSVLGS